MTDCPECQKRLERRAKLKEIESRCREAGIARTFSRAEIDARGHRSQGLFDRPMAECETALRVIVKQALDTMAREVAGPSVRIVFTVRVEPLFLEGEG